MLGCLRQRTSIHRPRQSHSSTKWAAA